MSDLVRATFVQIISEGKREPCSLLYMYLLFSIMYYSLALLGLYDSYWSLLGVMSTADMISLYYFCTLLLIDSF